MFTGFQTQEGKTGVLFWYKVPKVARGFWNRILSQLILNLREDRMVFIGPEFPRLLCVGYYVHFIYIIIIPFFRQKNWGIRKLTCLRWCYIKWKSWDSSSGLSDFVLLTSSPHYLSAKDMILNVIQALKIGNKKSYYHNLPSMTTGFKFIWKNVDVLEYRKCLK